MLRNQTWLSSNNYYKVIPLTILFALSTIFGCGGGAGGESNPVTSNLSTTPSTEADSSSAADANPPSSDVASLPDDPHNGDEEAPVDALNSNPEDGDASLTADSQLGSPASGSPEGQAEENLPPPPPTGVPVVAMNSTSTGATAEVTWPPSADPNVNGYYVYYGKQPSGEPGVCSYEERYAVDSPSVTITDLEPNTPYFFAVSSYSSYESPCTNETAVVTPPARA